MEPALTPAESGECKALEGEGRARWRFELTGVVQGVGFRPFVHRLARRFELGGTVCNSAAGVEIEVEGPKERLAAFARALEHQAPPAAHIEEFARRELAIRGEGDFTITITEASGPPTAGVVPDLALCRDCLREMEDPADRRYLYPFINCTNCGPRYTIIEKIPYDRPNTTMSAFRMCPSCLAEYHDPASRRFHAQPNACPQCGPTLTLINVSDHRAPHLAAISPAYVREYAAPGCLPQAAPPCDRLHREPRDHILINGDDEEPVGGWRGKPVHGAEALEFARGVLERGGILAVKGVGGFHLAVNAADGKAVARLRERKGRVDKPLALMVRDLERARSLVELGVEGEKILSSTPRPIVLARRSPGVENRVASEVAPGSGRLGVMLAYTPLHYLLLSPALPVLVMTSANRSGEPICIDNGEALSRLRGVADAFLLHDRKIARGNDDSVVSVVEPTGSSRASSCLPQQSAPLFLRRGRGYAPALLALEQEGPALLAVGAELKNTICLVQGGRAVLSQHLGDLQNLESYRLFSETIADLQRLFALAPKMVVHDLHPDYLSSRWAVQWAAEHGLPGVAVQHHHAHLAAVLAENRHPGPALGLILDGTGYGPDNTIWGGEILLGDAASCTRYGHLETMPLAGGDLAVRQPWRAALGYLHRAFAGHPPALATLAGVEREQVMELLDKNLNCPRTSSCGRLFDAVAAMAGGAGEISYEAQAAIELMEAAGGAPSLDGGEPRPFAYRLSKGSSDALCMEITPLIRDVAMAVAEGVEFGEIGRRFHHTLVKMFTEALGVAAAESGVKSVALGGGVMQNELLLGGLIRSLESAGLRPLLPQRLPPNDGGIAFGQAAVALATM